MTATRRKNRHQAVPMLPEIRHMVADKLEIRESTTDPSGDTVEVEGMWCRYNVGYMVRDSFGEFEERMLPGVCGDLLTRADVRFLVDHDPSRLLARTVSKTLRLSDSADGAMMNATIDLRDTEAHNQFIRIERGDVSGMSCGFIVARDAWNDTMDERDIQLFRDLLDVSSVTYPASPTTDIDIARRMLDHAPVESRARIRKFYIDMRAGKQFSADSVGKIEGAVNLLRVLVDDDPGEERSGEPVDVPDPDMTPEVEPPEERQLHPERRDSASYSDIEQQVCAALTDHLADRGVQSFDMWLDDCGDGWAVFTVWGSECQSFKITFELGDDGSVVFGDYDAVDRVTTWEPVGERSDPATDDDASVSESRSNMIRLRIEAGKRRG